MWYSMVFSELLTLTINYKKNFTHFYCYTGLTNSKNLELLKIEFFNTLIIYLKFLTQ